MSVEYATALQILLIGMFTVFVILSIVVLWGGTLIRLVNRFSIQDHSSDRPKSVPPIAPKSAIPSQKVAVISSAVHIATHGRAKVVQVEKAL